MPRSLLQKSDMQSYKVLAYILPRASIFFFFYIYLIAVHLTLLLHSVQVEVAVDGPPPTQTSENRKVGLGKLAGLFGMPHPLCKSQTVSEQKLDGLLPCMLLQLLATKQKTRSLQKTHFLPFPHYTFPIK